MTGVLSDTSADAVDEVTLGCCIDCDAPYAVIDGWNDRCPSCCALADDHDIGLHHTTPLRECLVCDQESNGAYPELPAIA